MKRAALTSEMGSGGATFDRERRPYGRFDDSLYSPYDLGVEIEEEDETND